MAANDIARAKTAGNISTGSIADAEGLDWWSGENWLTTERIKAVS